MRRAAAAWAVIVLLILATIAFLMARAQPLWPWGFPLPSRVHIVLRYELIAAVFLGYATSLSLSSWSLYRRLSAEDERNVQRFVDAGQWHAAARTLHRYCLLHSSVWRKVPATVKRWDVVIRPHLPKKRRLYIYHDWEKPELPPQPESGFAPEIVPLGAPAWWKGCAVLMLATFVYAGLTFAFRQPSPNRLRALTDINLLLMVGLLLGYGVSVGLNVLGRRKYFRFAPGLAQIMQFRIFHKAASVESVDIRAHDTFLDLSGSPVTLSFIHRDTREQRFAYPLPYKEETIRAALRSILSTAPTPPLPDEQLVD